MSEHDYIPLIWEMEDAIKRFEKALPKEVSRRIWNSILRAYNRRARRKGEPSFKNAPKSQKEKVRQEYWKSLHRAVQNEKYGKENVPDVSDKERNYKEGLRAWSRPEILGDIEKSMNPQPFQKEVFEIKQDFCPRCHMLKSQCICHRICPNCGDMLDNSGVCWGCGYGVNES